MEHTVVVFATTQSRPQSFALPILCSLLYCNALDYQSIKSSIAVSYSLEPTMANDEFDALDALEREAKEYDKVRSSPSTASYADCVGSGCRDRSNIESI